MTSISDTLSDILRDIIATVSGDVPSICKDALGSTVESWREAQTLKAMTVGGVSAVIPVVGYLTLPADLLLTLRLMHRAATGIAFIRLGQADDDTFAGILAVWSGAAQLNEELAKQMAAKTLATTATTIGGQTGIALSIKAFSLATGAIAAKKLGPKIAQKLTAKMAKRLAAKATTRWIPFLSAVAGAGANWWILDGLCDAAVEYCDFIEQLS